MIRRPPRVWAHRASVLALALLPGREATAVPGVELEITRADHEAVERLADGREFNRDEGLLTERRLGLHGLALGGWRGRLELARADAHLVYTGRSNLGLPLLSRTAWRHEQLDALAVRDIGLGRTLHGRVGLGLGLSTSVRAIAATDVSLPLTERLRRQDALLDLGLRWQPGGAGWALVADGRLRRPLVQRLQAESPGGLDAVQLRPDAGSAWRLRLGLEAAVPFAPDWQLGLALHRERVRVGASGAVPALRDGVPIGTVSFPGITVRRRGSSLRLSAQF